MSFESGTKCGYDSADVTSTWPGIGNCSSCLSATIGRWRQLTHASVLISILPQSRQQVPICETKIETKVQLASDFVLGNFGGFGGFYICRKQNLMRVLFFFNFVFSARLAHRSLGKSRPE